MHTLVHEAYETTLASSISAGATSLTINPLAGSPSVAPFRIWIGREMMKVSAVTGGGNETYAVQRGIEGTDAEAHTAGDIILYPLSHIGAQALVHAETILELLIEGAGSAATVSDVAYGSSWNGITNVAPSKNAVYDKIESVGITAVEFCIDGGGSAITTATKIPPLEIPFACTINRATLVADSPGNMVLDLYKDSYANYPPTSADSICASAKPTLSAASKTQDTTLTGWNTTINAGDFLICNVDSASIVQRATLSVKVTRI